MNQSGSCCAPVLPGGALGFDRHVELKRVDQLVADDVVGVGERTAKRQHDAAAERLGDAAGAFAELALNRVGLLEVGMRGVEHERLPPAQLVAEHAAEPRVPAFGHPRGDVDPFARARVEVDVEVLGLQDLKIELLVLDLVASEVLRRDWRGQKENDAGDDHSRDVLNSGIHGAGPVQFMRRDDGPVNGRYPAAAKLVRNRDAGPSSPSEDPPDLSVDRQCQDTSGRGRRFESPPRGWVVSRSTGRRTRGLPRAPAARRDRA